VPGLSFRNRLLAPGAFHLAVFLVATGLAPRTSRRWGFNGHGELLRNGA